MLCLFVCTSVRRRLWCLSFALFVCQFVCLFVCSSSCTSVRLFVCLFLRLFRALLFFAILALPTSKGRASAPCAGPRHHTRRHGTWYSGLQWHRWAPRQCSSKAFLCTPPWRPSRMGVWHYCMCICSRQGRASAPSAWTGDILALAHPPHPRHT